MLIGHYSYYSHNIRIKPAIFVELEIMSTCHSITCILYRHNKKRQFDLLA